MRRFADWGRSKEWVFETEECPENEIYLETGCPKHALVQLINKGSKIFICDGKLTNKLRKELGWEKTDENDAKLVQELFHRDPSVFIQFTKPDEIELRMTVAMARYEQVNKDLVSLKNRRKAMLREFGDIPVYEKTISLFEEEKHTLLKEVQPFITQELSKIEHIRGVGQTLVARLLAVAHPNKFKGKSSYLQYCGYTASSRENNKYNRTAKSILYLMAQQTLMQKDPNYRILYDKVKSEQLEKTCADCWLTKGEHKCRKRKSLNQQTCPIRAHTVALNRVATALAKEFWSTLHNVSTIHAGDYFV